MAGADHPVNSRIDVSGSHEGAAANLTVALGNADLEVKPDYDGELRVLHIDAVLNLDIRMYEEEGMDLIADLYSLKKELFPEKEETPYERLLISSTSRCRVAGRIATEPPEMQILQICHSSGEVKLDEVSICGTGTPGAGRAAGGGALHHLRRQPSFPLPEGGSSL